MCWLQEKCLHKFSSCSTRFKIKDSQQLDMLYIHGRRTQEGYQRHLKEVSVLYMDWATGKQGVYIGEGE